MIEYQPFSKEEVQFLLYGYLSMFFMIDSILCNLSFRHFLKSSNMHIYIFPASFYRGRGLWGRGYGVGFFNA